MPTLHGLLESSASGRPEHICLRHGDHPPMTYADAWDFLETIRVTIGCPAIPKVWLGRCEHLTAFPYNRSRPLPEDSELPKCRQCFVRTRSAALETH